MRHNFIENSGKIHKARFKIAENSFLGEVIKATLEVVKPITKQNLLYAPFQKDKIPQAATSSDKT